MKPDPIFRIRKYGERWFVTRRANGEVIGYAFTYFGAIDIVCRSLGYGVAYR